jgi:hypothetical protein
MNPADLHLIEEAIEKIRDVAHHHDPDSLGKAHLEFAIAFLERWLGSSAPGEEKIKDGAVPTQGGDIEK